MKIFFKQSVNETLPIEEELTGFDIKDSIEKTRRAIEIAYAGFNNAVDVNLIDSYIYEINALQKRYEHLLTLAAKMGMCEEEAPSRPDSAVLPLAGQVFG